MTICMNRCNLYIAFVLLPRTFELRQGFGLGKGSTDLNQPGGSRNTYRALLFMASDPAFLFYPGDYLRDTQCLSESVQVAYDRIMCEHMRNICISQAQLNFFTKRLTEEQKSELLQVLTKVGGDWQIHWVAESIEKRRNYSESRRKNRTSQKPKPKNISSSYVNHMENENVIENVIKSKGVDFSDYQQWTEDMLSGNDYVFWQMATNEKIPQAPHVDHWIRDHLGLLGRYPAMKPPNQQRFRESCLKHVRENYKKQINANGKHTTKQQANTASLIEGFAKRYGTDADSR